MNHPKHVTFTELYIRPNDTYVRDYSDMFEGDTVPHTEGKIIGVFQYYNEHTGTTRNCYHVQWNTGTIDYVFLDTFDKYFEFFVPESGV